MFATYSGDLSRPSIFNDATPARLNSGSTSSPAKSCGLSRYRLSPSGTGLPSDNNSYGIRQAWAHSPRLAERPPSASLVRHWPEYATHNAPWTNTSRGRDAGADFTGSPGSGGPSGTGVPPVHAGVSPATDWP